MEQMSRRRMVTGHCSPGMGTRAREMLGRAEAWSGEPKTRPPSQKCRKEAGQ